MSTELLATTCYPHDGWPFPFLFPLIFLALLLVVAFGPWRPRRWHGEGGLHVLRERYARGEIDEAEYRERLAVLRRR